MGWAGASRKLLKFVGGVGAGASRNLLIWTGGVGAGELVYTFSPLLTATRATLARGRNSRQVTRREEAAGLDRIININHIGSCRCSL